MFTENDMNEDIETLKNSGATPDQINEYQAQARLKLQNQMQSETPISNYADQSSQNIIQTPQQISEQVQQDNINLAKAPDKATADAINLKKSFQTVEGVIGLGEAGGALITGKKISDDTKNKIAGLPHIFKTQEEQKAIQQAHDSAAIKRISNTLPSFGSEINGLSKAIKFGANAFMEVGKFTYHLEDKSDKDSYPTLYSIENAVKEGYKTISTNPKAAASMGLFILNDIGNSLGFSLTSGDIAPGNINIISQKFSTAPASAVMDWGMGVQIINKFQKANELGIVLQKGAKLEALNSMSVRTMDSSKEFMYNILKDPEKTKAVTDFSGDVFSSLSEMTTKSGKQLFSAKEAFNESDLLRRVPGAKEAAAANFAKEYKDYNALSKFEQLLENKDYIMRSSLKELNSQGTIPYLTDKLKADLVILGRQQREIGAKAIDKVSNINTNVDSISKNIVDKLADLGVINKEELGLYNIKDEIIPRTQPGIMDDIKGYSLEGSGISPYEQLKMLPPRELQQAVKDSLTQKELVGAIDFDVAKLLSGKPLSVRNAKNMADALAKRIKWDTLNQTIQDKANTIIWKELREEIGNISPEYAQIAKQEHAQIEFFGGPFSKAIMEDKKMGGAKDFLKGKLTKDLKEEDSFLTEKNQFIGLIKTMGESPLPVAGAIKENTSTLYGKKIWDTAFNVIDPNKIEVKRAYVGRIPVPVDSIIKTLDKKYNYSKLKYDIPVIHPVRGAINLNKTILPPTITGAGSVDKFNSVVPNSNIQQNPDLGDLGRIIPPSSPSLLNQIYGAV